MGLFKSNSFPLQFIDAFLIKSFSVDGNLVTAAKDLELPTSVSKKPLEVKFTFAITKHSLLVDGERIASVESFENSDSLLIPELYNWIIEKRALLADSATIRDVLIQADKELEYNVIKRVAYSCSRAGIKEYSVMVISEGAAK